jgi:MerR family transcriptional regulator, light-induced transcriptional regulator
MHYETPSRQPSTYANPERTLSIGELAGRTGLQPATIRMWESRHGFPRATRRNGGSHRRYAEADVDLVRQVIRRRNSGVRLEAAIAEVALLQAALQGPPEAPSVYAAMRNSRPELHPERLKKSTLIGLSWAIEDECAARAEKPALFGGFQEDRYYRASEERWTELARIARSTFAFAAFSRRGAARDTAKANGITRVDLPGDSPMRREWLVICDAPHCTAMLTAWELPGQSTVPDRQRLFETIWTVDPPAVREAARVCASMALQLGHEEAAPVLFALAEAPPPPSPELQRVAGLLNRVVAYVDSAS